MTAGWALCLGMTISAVLLLGFSLLRQWQHHAALMARVTSLEMGHASHSEELGVAKVRMDGMQSKLNRVALAEGLRGEAL